MEKIITPIEIFPHFRYFFHRNAWVLCANAAISGTALKLLSTEAVFSSKCTRCRLAARLRLNPSEEFKYSPNLLAVAERRGGNRLRRKERAKERKKMKGREEEGSCAPIVFLF